jgi:hypothetical protein
MREKGKNEPEREHVRRKAGQEREREDRRAR